MIARGPNASSRDFTEYLFNSGLVILSKFCSKVFSRIHRKNNFIEGDNFRCTRFSLVLNDRN